MITTASAGLVVGEAREGGEQDLAPRQVEPRAGLVEQQQARPGDERARDQRALALALGAVAEPALGRARPRPKSAEQRVRAVDVEHRAAAPRSTRSSPVAPVRTTCAHGQERREAGAVARVDEPDRLAQAGDVGAAHRLAEDLDRAAARELDRRRPASGASSCRRRSARAGPSARRRAPSQRDAVEQGLARRRSPRASARPARPRAAARARLTRPRSRRLHWLTD